jgi:UDP-N-acetyl-D-glucosamine dehydrogenase
MRVVVVGQGYVGLPLAVRAVEAGHEVVGFDVDAQKTAKLAAGSSYIDDVPDTSVDAALSTGRFLPSNDARDCAGFDVSVITVPTPLHEGAPDLSFIRDAAITLARYVRPGTTVVLESTTYPGTTEELLGALLEEGSGLKAGDDFHLGYSPERIDPGNTTWTLQNTPKVVSGIDATSLEAVQRFYDTIVDETIAVSGTREAELAKLLENTFRHVNIALVNELAMFAADMNIDLWEAIDAATTKPFGFMRFTPGPGVGGHCLPIDPSYLSWRVKRTLGHPFRFVELANDVNDHMPEYVVRRITMALNRQGRSVNGSRIMVLGLAYKKNTGDAREAPSRVLIEKLLGLGGDIHAVDPHVPIDQVVPGVLLVELTAEELQAAQIVVLVTDHDAFDYSLVAKHAQAVFDCRHRFDAGPNVEHL